MISRICQLPCLLLAVGTVLMINAASGQDAHPQRRAKVITFTPAENVNELYIAIMGEVAQPGTYHLDPTSLKLQSVVQKAGGLTSDASMTIRVIRQGRVSHKEIFSERGNSTLMAGDLLVVDAKQPAARFSGNLETPREQVMVHANYEERATSSGVQIALLNVANYPVVLRLRHDEANAANIVEKLGQSFELLSNTYVITPDTFPRSSSESAKRAIRLAEGSVMVFERESVNRNRLPSTLPKPIESNIALGAQSGLIGSPQGQSPELRNVGERMASSSSETVDFSSQFRRRMEPESAQSLPPDLRQQINDRNEDSPPSVGTTKPRIANLPFTGFPRITNSSSRDSQSGRTTSESIPQPDDSVDDAAPLATAPALSLDEPVSPPPPAVSVPQVSIIFLIVGTLSGMALLVRRLLEAKPADLRAVQMSIPANEVVAVETAVIGEQVVAKSQLERLIKNEIPTTIEAVVFPSELKLQGRIAAKPILRVDGAQSILKQNRPHFGAADRSTNDSSFQEVIAELDRPEVNSIRRPHFIDAEQQKVASRASTSGDHTEVSLDESDARSKAPLAKALFQLEQGGRS